MQPLKILEVHRRLKQLYYDPESESGFSSISKLWKAAKEDFPNLQQRDVKQWLQQQLTYTLHYPARRNFLRNRVIASSPGELGQADLVDMQMYADHNDGYKFLLTFIDVFSKVAFAVPLKSRSADSVKHGFESIFDQYRPYMIQTDRGTEFTNAVIKQFMKRSGINHYFAYNQDVKCSVVERFNRTLKSRMFKYFTANGTRRWVDVVESLIQAYNNSYHRSIKMKPNEVTGDTTARVFQNLYGFASERQVLEQNPREPTKFNVGDHVRIKYHVEPMEKAYYPNYGDVVYQVSAVVRRYPKPVYQVKDGQGSILHRKLYAEDLQPVSKDTRYRIESIIKRRTRRGRREVLVKWLNYNSSYNSWIPESAVKDVS